nr:hypothetical protein [Tanacetum cinerariifolium]
QSPGLWWGFELQVVGSSVSGFEWQESGENVAKAPAVASKVPYLAALVALLSTRAIVMALALCTLGQRSFIWFPLFRPHIIDLGDILLFEGLLLMPMGQFLETVSVSWDIISFDLQIP